MSRFTHIDCDQRSEMWRRARAGKATASRAHDIRAKIKSGEAAGRRNYRIQLTAERLTGVPQDNGFISPAMQQGIDKEPAGISAYEALTGNLVTRTGFLALNEVEAGCSLDGHFGDFETLVSLKCPQPATHVSYWKEARLPPEYVHQAEHELWVTGARTYHFVSYNDSFPEELQLFVVEVDRTELDIASHEYEVLRFLKEVDAEVESLRNAKNPWVMHALVARQAG